jgi:hypothetical protein
MTRPTTPASELLFPKAAARLYGVLRSSHLSRLVSIPNILALLHRLPLLVLVIVIG